MKILFFVTAFAFSASSFAAIRVAFFSTIDSNGKIIEFEPGGKYSHVAIAYKSGWLHADPKSGVEFVVSIDKIGHLASILFNASLPDITSEQVLLYSGKPYDRSFKWNDRNSTYCSKLVANLLQIDPLPMSFSAQGWNTVKNLPINELGLSPDDLHVILFKRSFVETYSSCDNLLGTAVSH